MLSESLHLLSQQLQVVLSSLELNQPDVALKQTQLAVNTFHTLQREWMDYCRTLRTGDLQIVESTDVSRLETLYLILRRNRRSG